MFYCVEDFQFVGLCWSIWVVVVILSKFVVTEDFPISSLLETRWIQFLWDIWLPASIEDIRAQVKHSKIMRKNQRRNLKKKRKIVKKWRKKTENCHNTVRPQRWHSFYTKISDAIPPPHNRVPPKGQSIVFWRYHTSPGTWYQRLMSSSVPVH